MPRYVSLGNGKENYAPTPGVLITNLGSPLAPTTRAVRRYLAEFLHDPRMVELPRWLWYPILHGFILRVRPRQSARAYASIWTERGSPLIAHTQAIGATLAEQLKGQCHVAVGMRYGKPRIKEALNDLRDLGVNRLLVLPLFPQYASATTGSIFDAVSAVLKTWRWVPELRMMNHYATDPAYLAAQAAHIQATWQQQEKGDCLLFSFHGLPQRSIAQGDPYYHQCRLTAQGIASELGLHANAWKLVFQSRFGPTKWLSPYCDTTLKALAQDNYKRIDIVCPGFAADCLETLEEIAIRYAETFKAAGGEQLNYIPALNALPAQCTLLLQLIRKHAADWLDSPTATRQTAPSIPPTTDDFEGNDNHEVSFN